MTREEAKKEAIRITDEALRPEGIDDECWALFTMYVFVYDEDKLADDLLTGIANGHSIEEQGKILKTIMKPYREQYQKMFDEVEEFKKSLQ